MHVTGGQARRGTLVLVVVALLAFAATLISARMIGLSTAEPSHRMRLDHDILSEPVIARLLILKL
ncbi:MAG TPA: hypothetical protein VGV17_04170 [Bosea sp. (in: a-proteobacteria)]|jgi:cation transporter-like permease|uniref:hypothetical protein n=1 Tax=Bosea sp. (in: a-proteobacteria) TaxID=1871050 RepID=UPI002DDD2114|nr:hypothetical protein [Bosea sp. (in: a-proteobacteria)]HEV2552943.1 hypothetical protein [Bosea sp. (in: a-proteobacteria)]